MIKRLIDFSLFIVGLIVFFPIIFIFSLLIFLKDFGSPIYYSDRVGLNGKKFKMYKLRSMIINADKSGVDSTKDDDTRITKIGMIIRKYKIDEITQLINVLLGNMSLVGPRPNVIRETRLYTLEEKKILDVKPGITDFSSIIFSDEGKILSEFSDPDIAYNQIIRPYKSRLSLFYSQNSNTILDLKIIFYTILSLISRKLALNSISKLLKKLKADPMICDIALRENQLVPFPPPGSKDIVISRELPLD